MKKNIGFDITGKERGRIKDNYTVIRSQLKSLGFGCEEYQDFPIRYEDISKYDILIFPCPDNSKFSLNELNVLTNYVKNGGNLVLLNHAGGDKGRRTNLSVLSEIFGIRFNNDQVFDKEENLDLESFPLVNTYAEYYSERKIDKICYRIGCSLEVLNNSVLPLAITSPKAEPDNAIIAALSEYEKGKVICIGSYEMFRDEVKGGITYSSNLDFFLFLIEILISEEIKNDRINERTILDMNNKISNEKNKKIEMEDVNIKEKFNEFQNQVYELLKQQQLNSDQLNMRLEAFDSELKRLRNLQQKMSDELNNIHDNVLGQRRDDLNYDQTIIDNSINYEIIQNMLTEFKLEFEFINKKLEDLEIEQKRINKLLKNHNNFNRKRSIIEENDLLSSDEKIVFIKASDLVNKTRPQPQDNRIKNKDIIKQASIEKPIQGNLEMSNDPKSIQIKKFLEFLKRQFEIGILNEEEYLDKKAKIECKIREII
ncbi:MAG: hypothetical protein ACTSPY_16105 [Candidatus Helarchaeota archaeon]